MQTRKRNQDPFADIVRSQQEEINKYKWIESERVGQDIGWERAAREWMQKYFPDWKRYRWERAIGEALQPKTVSSRKHSGLN
jgi:hypothetical protein